MHKMTIVGIFYIICFNFVLYTVDCDLQLSSLDYGNIVEVSQSRCVVSIPKTLVDDKVLSLLSSAAASFINEPKTAFYLVDFSTKHQDSLPRFNYNNSFVVFKLIRKDRSCLLTPEKPSGKLKPEIYSFRRVSDYDIDKIVDFINNKCLTFRKRNGYQTPQGIHEVYILNNLYSVINEATEKCDSGKDEDSELGEVDNESFCSVSSDGMKRHTIKTVHDSADEHIHSYSQKETAHHCDRIPLPIKPSEFLNEYVTKSKPVIIAGGALHWHVFKKWKNHYLKEMYRDIKVHIKITPNGEYEGVEPSSLWENKSKVKIPQDVLKQLSFPDLVVVRPATMEIQFSEFIDLIESIASSKSSNISAYLEYSSITYFPGLEKDISEMSFIADILNLKHTNIWLSDGNTVGKLHFDPFDNFMCQISGEKEFILYDPHRNERLYEAHIQEAILSYNKSSKKFSRQKLMESTSMVMSPVDIEKPDFERFPRFAEAKPMSCKIQPGDVLFTPAFWWHEVRSKPSTTEHRNLAVNFWYDPFFLKEFPCPECRLYVNPNYFNLL